MVTIHVPGDAHVTPVGVHTWNEYADAKKKKVVQDALFILKNNIKGFKPCNDCFKRLPGGRSFDDILGDATIFISFDPGTAAGDFGATIGNDVTITAFAIGMGRWTVAATLVHEFAHVNGAGGADATAENTLNCCGLKALHNPRIIGSTNRRSGSRLA